MWRGGYASGVRTLSWMGVREGLALSLWSCPLVHAATRFLTHPPSEVVLLCPCVVTLLMGGCSSRLFLL